MIALQNPSLTVTDLNSVLVDLRARFALPTLPIEVGKGVTIFPGIPEIIIDAPCGATDALVDFKWTSTVTDVGRIAESAKLAILDAKERFVPTAQQPEIQRIAAKAVARIDDALKPMEAAFLDAIDRFTSVRALQPMSDARAAQHAAQRSDVRGFLIAMPLPDRLDALLDVISDRSDEAEADLCARAVLELGAIGTKSIFGSEMIRSFVVQFTKAAIAPEKYQNYLAAKLGLLGARHVFQSATTAIGNTATTIASAALMARDDRLAGLN